MAEIAAEAAPAKINLALHVIGRRADGYHELQSLVAFLGIGDELLARTAPADTLMVTGPFGADLGNGRSNLVSRAVAAFRAAFPGRIGTGLGIELRKNLPVASGLGGGSADAAAALRLMAGLCETPPDPVRLGEVALSLGADVPMCLYSRTCEVRGIGELITPVPSFPALYAVLVNPLQALATAEVFRRLSRRENPPLPPLPRPLAHAALFGLWAEGTRNDLEGPAMDLVPEISNILMELLHTNGCLLARMSGAGATVFGLYGSSALAHQAAHDLRARWPDHWVAAAPLL